MGRASLFLCGGFAIIFGIIQMNIHNGQIGLTKLNVDYVNQVQARNMASSGMEIGIKEIMEHGMGWRPVVQPWTITVDGYTVDVYIDDRDSHPLELEYNQIRVRAESSIENRNGMAYAILQREVDFPPIPGAMGFYGTSSSLQVNGNAVKIDGRDHDIGYDNPNGDIDEYMPGVVGVRSLDETITKNAQSGHEYIMGEPVSYDHDPDLDGQPLLDHIEKELPYAEVKTNGYNMGTLDMPRVMKVEGNVSGEDNGAGVLIIPPGNTFTATGNFIFYGLIIVQGELIIRGNVRIYGSILFTENSIADIDDADEGEAEFSGNSYILYSSEAIRTVQSNLHNTGRPEIVSIFD